MTSQRRECSSPSQPATAATLAILLTVPIRELSVECFATTHQIERGASTVLITIVTQCLFGRALEPLWLQLLTGALPNDVWKTIPSKEREPLFTSGAGAYNSSSPQCSTPSLPCTFFDQHVSGSASPLITGHEHPSPQAASMPPLISNPTLEPELEPFAEEPEPYQRGPQHHSACS